MAAVTFHSNFGDKENKVSKVSIVSPFICHEMIGLDAKILVFLNVEFQASSPLSPSSRGSLVPLSFCHKGGVICISEVTGISPCNLDSSLCFIQPGILHDVLCIEVK